jgi:hypothetical protein
LIKSFDNDEWQHDIPMLLKTDMGALTQGDGGATMSDRIIQTSLDSLVGFDAEKIKALFQKMAVFAEGAVCRRHNIY